MNANPPQPLVGADWLRTHWSEADLRIVDASWRLPGGGDARTDYERRHIPGAVFFPLDEIADRRTDLPHMLPPPREFESAVGALGISANDHVVVYDDLGLFSAARVWWTFRVMGHRNVGVLDGGLPAWTAAGGAVTSKPVAPEAATYHARFDPTLVADHGAVRRALSAGAPVLDARPAGRFEGREAEPRPGLLRGAMPGARNIPFTALVSDGRLKPPDALAAAFDAAGVSPDDTSIATCGSGVTAAILVLALEALGRPPARLYDGAWAEWGRTGADRTLFPVVPGAC